MKRQHVFLPEFLIEKIQELAIANGVSRGAMIRILLVEALKNLDDRG